MGDFFLGLMTTTAVPPGDDFLQGKWRIEPDGEHEFVVTVTVTGREVIFSDFPRQRYTFVRNNGRWSVNGWVVEQVKSDLSGMILTCRNHSPAIWTRPVEWAEHSSSTQSSFIGQTIQTYPQTNEFLQGEWEIDPDTSNPNPVIATITQNIATFSDYPGSQYRLQFSNGCWNVNGWQLTSLSQDYLSAVFTKGNETPARWVRSANWIDANIPKIPGRCLLCFGDQPSGIYCTNRHYICNEDCIHFVSTSVRTLDDLNPYVTDGSLKCVNPQCDGIYNTPEIGKVLTSNLRTQLLDGLHALRIKKDASALLNSLRGADFDEEGTRNVYRRVAADGTITYNAWMCPACRFGPVDHQFCTNLRSHHNQQVGNVRINNACPNCNFFTERLADWLQWDGKFLKMPN